MPASSVRDMVTPDVWNGYFKFCNIRNPWDKVVSFFHFQHHNMRDKPQANIVNAFRRWLLETANYGYDSDIFLIDGKSVVDDVVRHHRIDADLHAICAKIGLEAPVLPQLKAEFRKKALPYVDYYDDVTREKVASLYDKDIDLFGWTFEDALS